jgi:multidrug efflux pump subunit AcrA (membrane-fusion protein)
VTAAILILVLFSIVFWLVFFKFKWLKLSPGWGIISAFFVLHVLLVFVTGPGFVTPYATNATVVQHTIQIIPRLPEPTLVTAVFVEENVPVKKEQPLFQLDHRPYEYKVEQLEAQLAEAKQNVLVLNANWLPFIKRISNMCGRGSTSRYRLTSIPARSSPAKLTVFGWAAEQDNICQVMNSQYSTNRTRVLAKANTQSRYF